MLSRFRMDRGGTGCKWDTGDYEWLKIKNSRVIDSNCCPNARHAVCGKNCTSETIHQI